MFWSFFDLWGCFGEDGGLFWCVLYISGIEGVYCINVLFYILLYWVFFMMWFVVFVRC